MRENWARFGLCLSIGFACALAARPAQAEPKLDGAVQLSLSGSVLGYSSLKWTFDQPGTSAPGAGPLVAESSQTVTSTLYGLPGAGLGLGLGVGLSDNVLLGAQVILSGSKASVEGASSDGSTLQFLPRLEYVFDDSENRPFFAAVAGVGHTSSTSSPSGSSSQGQALSTSVDSSTTTYYFGGSLGVHAFLSDTFSIDPALTVLGLSGTGTSNSSSMTGTGNSYGETQSLSGYQVLFSIGLSGWLGGSSSHPVAPAVQIAPAVQAPPTMQTVPIVQPPPAPQTAPRTADGPRTATGARPRARLLIRAQHRRASHHRAAQGTYG